MRGEVLAGPPVPSEACQKTYRSEYLIDEEGQSKHRAEHVRRRRALLRQVVPSSTWFDDLTAVRGRRFPLPSMVLSTSATLFPTDDGTPSRSSQRFFPAIAYRTEEGLDDMEWREAARYRSPPAWSAWLRVFGRPPRPAQLDPLKDEPILRSVKLGEYPTRHKVAFNDRHAERTYVRVRYDFRVLGEDNLHWPWEAGKIEICATA